MTLPRSRGRSFVRGQKRQVTWIGPADQGYISVGAAGSTLLADFAPGTVGIDKPTIVRTRGDISIVPAVLSADLEVVGAFGVGVVSAQAFAIGITAIPKPFDDANWDGWYVWQAINFVVEAGATVQSFSPADRIITVDSKAMRKIADNEVLVLVAQSQQGAFRISAPLRTLLKLS